MTTKTRMFVMIAVLLFCAVAAIGTAAFSWGSKRKPFTTESDNVNVQRAYAVARRMPEILEQIPCHCGCIREDGKGHRSNLDCFKTTHGEQCPMCVMAALTAERMIGAGKSVQDIKRYLNNVNGFQLVPQGHTGK